MRALLNTLPLVLFLPAAATFDSPASALTNCAEASVTETPTRVTVENESVKLVFAATTNYVPTELSSKQGSGRNLIVDSFCLYYQYIEERSRRSLGDSGGGMSPASRQAATCVNVKALKAYAEAIRKALDAKAKEAEALRAECRRPQAEATERPCRTPAERAASCYPRRQPGTYLRTPP